MKNYNILNEDVNITDPELMQQYTRGQSMIVQKDQLINQLQDKINTINKDKMKIQAEMNKIQQAAAKKQGQEATDTSKTNTQGEKQETVQVTGTPVKQTSESILIKINEQEDNLDEIERLESEIDLITDKITFLQNTIGDGESIKDLKYQLRLLIDEVETLRDQMEEVDNYHDYEDEDDLNSEDDDEWIDPAGGKHYGNEEDPAAMYEENYGYEEENQGREDFARQLDDLTSYDPRLYDEHSEDIEDYHDQQYRKELEDEDYRWRSQKEEDDYEDLDESYNDVNYQLSDFNGLEEAAKGYYPFKILDVRRDPGYGYENVFLMLIQFINNGKKRSHMYNNGSIGLCIYDTEKQEFIEDPTILEDYNITPEKLYSKYRFIVPGYEHLEEAEESPRYTRMIGDLDRNYELDKRGKPIKKLTHKDFYYFKKPRKRRVWSDEKIEKYENLEREISDIKDTIKYMNQDIESELEQFEPPSFRGVEGEMEQFWAELSHDQREVLNSGMYKNNKERIEALKKYGAEKPEYILDNYYYYYPEYDEEKQKHKAKVEKLLDKPRKEIEKLEKQLEKKEKQLDDMGYPVYNLDDNYNPMRFDIFYNLNENKKYDPEMIDYRNDTREDYLDEDYVFYIKVIDGDNWFIGKIFKVNPDGDWYGKIKKGDDDSFEKMSYEGDYEETDIVDFLADNYEKVEIIDIHEFNDYLENDDKFKL